MSNAIAVVLAAGKGTRMKSDRPKVLCEALGRPLVAYVLDSLLAAGTVRILVVVGYRSDDVRDALSHYDRLDFVEQTEQLGTGHAVQVCRKHLVEHDGPVIVVAGDSPMLRAESIRRLLQAYEQHRPACILGTLHKTDPSGLGRIVRDENGDFQGIVEEKDATETQRAITEVNMSTYVFDACQLVSALDRLQNDNRQAEYYLTDCPGILRADGKDVRALPVLQDCEALSVNTLDELKIVEDELQRL